MPERHREKGAVGEKRIELSATHCMAHMATL